MYYAVLLCCLLNISLSRDDDYWSKKFDRLKNCESEDEVNVLRKGASQCRNITIKASGDKAAFLTCVKYMNQALVKLCGDSDVKEPGKLLYCKNRGVIHCCFKDHKCETWATIYGDFNMFNKARDYLLNTTGFLDHQVKRLGYKTCHHLDSLDATKCADDCNEQRKGTFAKECEEKGGLFKCCIRRDKRFCDKCRFCCTLPMCSMDPGGEKGTTFEGEHLELKDQSNEKTAVGNYFSTLHRFMTDDYYCLKPDDKKDPKYWEQYDMESFRKAFTKEALDNVRTYKYDKNLNNFVDPKVLKVFTKNEKRSYKAWRESYLLQMRRIPFFDEDNPEGKSQD